jgi:outer membrane protein TolC
MRYLLSVAALVSSLAPAQESLSVRQAVELALTKNGSVESAAEGAKASQTRIAAARGALLPQIQYTESWQRSNNPVFVFSSLLTQHQFGLQNFEIYSLNRPAALNNFQSQVWLDQSVWDNGYRRSQIKSAELGNQVSAEEERRIRMQTVAAVVRGYYNAVLMAESLAVAEQATKSAEADLVRARNRRQAGVVTDADVLSIQVHLASMQEQRIRRSADLEIARAALNQSIGLPLDSRFDLATKLKIAALPEGGAEALERDAADARPEARQAFLATQLAETERTAARSAIWPEVFVRAGFEADRQNFYEKGGANWMASAGFRWNIFTGLSDRAKIRESEHAILAAAAERRYVESAAKLDARRAWLDLNAAQSRIDVAQSAVAMADENLRIIKNRYEAGLTDVTELLRTETALLETKTRYLEAVQDQRVAVMQVELAAGRLSEKSSVVME